MFDRFRGAVAELSPTRVVFEVGGVGYDLSIPLSTFDTLKRVGDGESVVVFVHLHVREDDLRLFGFASKEERRLFRMVLAVSGVGPGIALAALSTFAPAELLGTLAAADSKALQRVKGIGRKVAERLVVELKDRAAALVGSLEPVAPSGASSSVASGFDPRDVDDAVRALVEIGYPSKSALHLVETSLAGFAARGERASLEDVIKECLRQ